jgi:hypothetical protein
MNLRCPGSGGVWNGVVRGADGTTHGSDSQWGWRGPGQVAFGMLMG